MRNHYQAFADTKQQYAQILRDAQERITQRLEALGSAHQCPQCPDGTPSLWQRHHPGCGYRHWQANALHTLEQEIGRELMAQLEGIAEQRNAIACHMCGMCCRLASSEYDYPTLQARAQAGDDFARQFTSIFLPYTSRQAAIAKYPEVVRAVLAESVEEGEGEEKVFFYHCPYIGEDNRCTLYGSPKRPSICASYPETPLAFVYEQCAWRGWKTEQHPRALSAHATLAVASEMAGRLKALLTSEE